MGTYDPFNSSVKSIIYVVMITSHVYVAYINFYAFVYINFYPRVHILNYESTWLSTRTSLSTLNLKIITYFNFSLSYNNTTKTIGSFDRSAVSLSNLKIILNYV